MTSVSARLTPYVLTLCFLVLCTNPVQGNPDAKRLYDDLLSSYNRLIRPVSNDTHNVTVKLGLRLSQLIELNLKDQILTTNVWVEHEWKDYKFMWDPEEYGGVKELYVPSEHIWVPDIVLYNNADGEYVVSTMTKAILHYNGRVIWNPPAIFKSYCEIDVRYFPFDQQHCFMKFGSWTYDGEMIDLQHINQQPGEDIVEIGIDLKEYYPSVEWDILSVPARLNTRHYPCCSEPYPDIYFNLTLRRKTLFYTVNLIIPCVGISYLSVLVFYLPADSGEKVALCINVLLSQTMFFLLISEIIPSTSLAVPLLGRYLLFTMFLVGFNVLITIIILNIHYRKPSTHKMAPWVRIVFIKTLPKLLLMRVPSDDDKLLLRRHRNGGHCNGIRYRNGANNGRLSIFSFTGIPPPPPPPGSKPKNGEKDMMSFELVPEKRYPVEIERTIRYVRYIQDHLATQDRINEEDADWGFVAMVLDRLFLWIFTIVSLAGTIGIICEAPALYDDTYPIDIQLSVVAQKQLGLDMDLDL